MQECGECTMCCWLTECRSTNSPVLNYCKECTPGRGCKIYTKRPEDCKTFQCSWSLDPRAHSDLRPDKSNVVFENLSKDIVFGTVDPTIGVSELIESQVCAFTLTGSSVILQTFESKPRMYLTDSAKPEQVWNFLQDKVREFRNDSS